MECFRLFFHHLAWIEHQSLSDIGDSRKAGSLWEIMRGVGGVRKSIHQSYLAKGLGLGVIYWCFKVVQERFRRKRSAQNRLSCISTRKMHQFTTLSLSPTFWPRWWSRHFLTLPIVQALLFLTSGYSLSSEAIIIRQLTRWKRLWRRSLTRQHKRTSMGPWRSCWNGTTSALKIEEITWKRTRVSCVFYQ